MVNLKEYHKWGFVVFLLFFIFLGLLLIKPYITHIITSALLVYALYPLYNVVNSKLMSRSLSAAILTLFIIIVILIPVLFILNSVLSQVPKIYSRAVQTISNSAIDFADLSSKIHEKLGITIDFSQIIQNVLNSLVTYIRNFLTSIPNKIFGIFIILFCVYFMFRDGDTIAFIIRAYAPLSSSERLRVLKELKQVTHALIYGHFITAISQGVIGGIGFFIFGVTSPAFWGIIMFASALIPFVGPALIYLPISISLIINNAVQADSFGLIKSAGLLIYGLLVISSVDNIVNIHIVGSRTQIHPMLILIGALGGINVFGVMGIFIGPIILTTLMTILQTPLSKLR